MSGQEIPDRNAETQRRRGAEIPGNNGTCHRVCSEHLPDSLLPSVGEGAGDGGLFITLSPCPLSHKGRGGAARFPFSRVAGEGAGGGLPPSPPVPSPIKGEGEPPGSPSPV